MSYKIMSVLWFLRLADGLGAVLSPGDLSDVSPPEALNPLGDT